MASTQSTYAYTTLVMLGDSYVPGALVLGWSLRRQKVKHALVVMVSVDVSIQARQALAKVYDRIIEVPLIEAQAVQKGWERFQHMYGWMNRSFTKINVLSLIEYAKVVLLDADQLAVANPDAVFDLPAPAGICSIVKDQERYHGRLLSEEFVRDSLRDYGIRGCFYLLEPNMADFEAMKRILAEKGGYGDTRYHLGADERLFTEFYMNRWTHVHIRYGCHSWKPELCAPQTPILLHYVSDKPWIATDKQWPDYLKWHEVAGELSGQFPEQMVPYLGKKQVRTQGTYVVMKKRSDDDNVTEENTSKKPRANELSSASSPASSTRIGGDETKDSKGAVLLKNDEAKAAKRTKIDVTLPSTSRFAYVTLLFEGNRDLPGALALAYSILHSGSQNDRVCMILRSVSDTVRTLLEQVFTSIIEVDVLQYACKPVPGRRPNLSLEVSEERSFTKWQALSLTQYERVLVLDCNQIMLKNLDSLFTLAAPAGSFAEPPPLSASDRLVVNPYKDFKHGDAIPSNAIHDGFYKQSFVALASGILLQPDADSFAKFRSMCKGRSPFGFDGCISPVDAQSIVRYYYEKEVPWTQIGVEFYFSLARCNSMSTESKQQMPAPYNWQWDLRGSRPWETPMGKSMDTDVWWSMVSAMTTGSKNNPLPIDCCDALHAYFESRSPKLMSLLGPIDCCYCRALGYPDRGVMAHAVLDPVTANVTCFRLA